MCIDFIKKVNLTLTSPQVSLKKAILWNYSEIIRIMLSKASYYEQLIIIVGAGRCTSELKYFLRGRGTSIASKSLSNKPLGSTIKFSLSLCDSQKKNELPKSKAFNYENVGHFFLHVAFCALFYIKTGSTHNIPLT